MPVKLQICLYGPSSTGKTTAFGTLAKLIYDETGKPSRLYSADGGGWGTIQHLVDAGIVAALDIGQRAYPFEAMRDATQGAWPADLKDPTSPMLPAFLYSYVAKCLQCEKVVWKGDKAPDSKLALACDKCKVPVQARVVREPNARNGIEKCGVVGFEGLTAYGEMLLDNMSDRSARGEKIGEDTAVRFKDGSVDVGAISRSSYGIAQRRVKSAVHESRHLPVDYIVWTALKARGTDDEKRVPVFGPRLVGQASTDDIPRWFGPTLSMALWPNAGKLERRLYLTSYFETFNIATKDIEHICNSRIPPVALDGVPEFIKFEASDQTLLGRVVRLIEERQAKAGAMLKSSPAVQSVPKEK